VRSTSRTLWGRIVKYKASHLSVAVLLNRVKPLSLTGGEGAGQGRDERIRKLLHREECKDKIPDPPRSGGVIPILPRSSPPQLQSGQEPSSRHPSFACVGSFALDRSRHWITTALEPHYCVGSFAALEHYCVGAPLLRWIIRGDV